MRKISILALLLFVLTPPETRLEAQTARPKLVVGLVIDQFRYDYLERFGDLFGEGGFRRLVQEGAVFTDAQYLHSVTVTAPGHAAFMSGSVPSLNGIIGNDWYDRAKSKTVTSVDDDDTKLVGATGAPGASPRRLIGSTLGDELKLSNDGASRVIGISMKDRAAILPAGHHPDGAYWFDIAGGKFVSSTYYMNELPSWAQRFNAKSSADAYFGQVWRKLRPESDYLRSGIDDSPFERPDGGRRVFPYTITPGDPKPSDSFYDNFLRSPFSNEMLAAFAKAAIEGEDLGNHATTDLLTISFSCNDVIGHNYGPYSHEVEDITLRTDLVLANLFEYLDRRLGRDNYIVAFTADHGVAPSPEQAQALGLGGGRFEEEDVVKLLSSALKTRFGDADWILAYQSDNIYLNHDVAVRRHVDIRELARATAEAALALPQFAAAYTREDFAANRVGRDPISQRIARSYYAGRTGDVFVVPKPYYVRSSSTSTHGSPYSYDTNVPVIFWGSSFVGGRYSSEASPADIAPTLASILHITRPSLAVGRVLSEALKSELARALVDDRRIDRQAHLDELMAA